MTEELIRQIEVPYRVLLDDLDFMGIVHHSKWLVICERLRTECLKLEYKSLLEQHIGVVISSAKIKYVRPAKYDDLLLCKLDISRVEQKNDRVQVRHSFTHEGILSVVVELILVFVDSSGKPVPYPSW